MTSKFDVLLGKIREKDLCSATKVIAPQGSTLNADYYTDGVADEVQINEAIQALPTIGGRILLMQGTYTISSAIVLNRNNCVIEGSGLDNTVIVIANNANCNAFQNTSTDVIIFNALKNFTVDGNRTQNTTGYGCYITKSDSGHFWDFYLRDVWFKECSNDGFYAYDGHGYVLDHVLSEYNDGNGITFAANGIDEPEIKNGTIKMNGGDGISIGSNGGIVSENEVTDNSGYGIKMSCIGGVVYGNNVGANTLSGIYVTSQYGVQIINNVIKSNKQHGVLVDTSDTIIVNNYLGGNGVQTSNTYDGIRIAHHRAIVSSNIIVGASITKYGVNFSASWTSGSVCIGNNISGTVGASINDTATGTLTLNQTLSKNLGVVMPIQAATASAPTYIKGGIYFDTTANKLYVGGATAWEAITSV